MAQAGRDEIRAIRVGGRVCLIGSVAFALMRSAKHRPAAVEPRVSHEIPAAQAVLVRDHLGARGMREERPVEWTKAVERADQIAASGRQPADTWDGRAIRGVLAVTLAALSKRQNRSVADVEIGSVLWHLDQGPSMVYELGAEMGFAAEGAQPEAAAVEWAWLIRRWPEAPARANSGGLPRGIARGSSLPAVDVVTSWAGAAAQAVLTAMRPAGLAPRTRVRVTGGEDEGRSGEVVATAWLMDDEQRTVKPGPPPGYEVVLSVPGQDGPRRAVMATLAGAVRIEAPGQQGERVIIRADDVEPEP